MLSNAAACHITPLLTCFYVVVCVLIMLAVPGFAACDPACLEQAPHGCDGCLAYAALSSELAAGLGRNYAIDIPQEPRVQLLNQLSTQQIVSVAVCVLTVVRIQQAALDCQPGQSLFVHVLAGAGAGKTTVLNIVTQVSWLCRFLPITKC